MVPGVYDAYLAAMATAAAALIGLLFVAVSVRDDTIFGPNAMPGGEALAITAFTGLVNSFVVSLLGLIPKTNIGEPAVIMAVIGIVAIVRLQRRNLRPSFIYTGSWTPPPSAAKAAWTTLGECVVGADHHGIDVRPSFSGDA